MNYGPLNIKLKDDIQQWNVISFLNFNSRIKSIKINFLPRLLYLF